MSIERRGDLRVLVGTPAVASVTWYQGSVVANPGDVTVSARRLSGTEFVPDAAVSGSGAAARTVALSAAELGQLDTITLTWTSTTLGSVTTRVVVEGDQLFTLSEARAFDVGAAAGPVLAKPEDYPDAVLIEARTRIADAFERICDVAFTPQFRLAVVDGYSQQSVMLPDLRVQEVIWAEIYSGTGWVMVDPADLDLDGGAGIVFRRSGSWPTGRRNIRIGYIHGHERVPDDIRRAALILCRYEVVASNVSDRTTSMSDETGTYRLATAGLTRGSWFGLPLVDSVLQRYVERIPGVA